MALLDEGVSAGEQARRAKFRLRHVGTKLNEAEGRVAQVLRTMIRPQPEGAPGLDSGQKYTWLIKPIPLPPQTGNFLRPD